MAEPFLKWAGGKRQLLSEIEVRLPSNIEQISTYIEPFVGGGAVMFYLLENYDFANVHIADINLEIVLCYQTIQSSAPSVIRELQMLIDSYPKKVEEKKRDYVWFKKKATKLIKNRESRKKFVEKFGITEGTYYSWRKRSRGPPIKRLNEISKYFLKEKRSPFYYSVREKWNRAVPFVNQLTKDKLVCRVAQTIFLNRTCYNGLYRVNNDGEFNVPIGSYDYPSFPTNEALLDVQTALIGVNIHHSPFENCIDWIDGASLVYFDPPYRPLPDKNSFVSYTADDFDDDDQRRLAKLFDTLDQKNVDLILSNSDPKNTNPNDEFFDELYDGYKIDRVLANRAINSQGNERGVITELLIGNCWDVT